MPGAHCLASAAYAARFVGVVVSLVLLKLVTWVATGFCLVPLLSPISAFPSKDAAGPRAPRVPWLPGTLLKLAWYFYVVLGVPVPRFYLRWLYGLVARANASVPDAETQPIPEADWSDPGFDREAFFKEYVLRPHPVVLRGFARSTAAHERWSVDWFVRKFGHEEAALKTPDADNVPGKLRDIDHPGVYLHNSEQVFVRHPELVKELDLHRLLPLVGDGRLANSHPRLGNLPVQLFLGREGTGTGFHCANGFNWFFMVEGEKRWTFVDPRWTPLMFPGLTRGALYQTSAVTDPNTVLARYLPLWRVCPRYEAVLRPGDVLLNPPWWWHCIENLTPATTAAATRWADAATLRPLAGLGQGHPVKWARIMIFIW